MRRGHRARPTRKATLEALERSNLFLVPLDDRRQWYRYHHLFADVLRARLLDEHPDARRRSCTGGPATGSPSTATAPRRFGHALAGGDVDRAAELIELALPACARRARSDLRRVARCPPGRRRRDRPVLAMGLVGAPHGGWRARPRRVARCSDDRAVARADARRASAATMVVVDDDAAAGCSPAQSRCTAPRWRCSRGDIAGTVAHAAACSRRAPDDDQLGRGAAAALIGLAALGRRRPRRCFDALRRSIAALRRIGHVADILGCLARLADIQVAQGRLARRGAPVRARLGPRGGPPADGPLRGSADMHVGLAEILLERDERAAAAEHLRRAHELGELVRPPAVRVPLARCAARLLLAEGRRRRLPRPARGGGAGLRHRLLARGPSGQCRAVHAAHAPARATSRPPRAWARERGLRPTTSPRYLREYEHSPSPDHLAQRRPGRRRSSAE